MDRVLADPPVVHSMSPQDIEQRKLTGVWSTDETCYRFLAERCRPGDRTLETGAGISTVLFALWGALHTCVAPGRNEIEAIVAYCAAHEIPTSSLTFVTKSSDRGLPELRESGPALDLVLIDGCHGFPAPVIDWYYGAGRLRHGGVVVIDDVHLPAVQVLLHYMDLDPRWRALQLGGKWVAFERLSEGPLLEDWYTQQFYVPLHPNVLRVAQAATRVKGRLRGAKGRLTRQSKSLPRPV